MFNRKPPFVSSPQSNDAQTADLYARLIESTGEDLTRAGLVDTPERASKAFSFVTQGYEQSLEEVTNGAIFPTDNDEMVMVNSIEFYSLCEHHVLPFYGVAHVGYLPDGKVLGLSKVARIVDMYARRLQIQESLTHQVAEAIQTVTGCRGVGVVMEASHMCMMMRGVSKQQSSTRTSAYLGNFKTDANIRQEFLAGLPK